MDLVVEVYKVVSNLPVEEKYGLSDQIRRCAVSIPANIAEGQKRNSKKEFIQFCSIARGSAAELETHLDIVERVYNLNTSKLRSETEQISKMISGLVNKLKE